MRSSSPHPSISSSSLHDLLHCCSSSAFFHIFSYFFQFWPYLYSDPIPHTMCLHDRNSISGAPASSSSSSASSCHVRSTSPPYSTPSVSAPAPPSGSYTTSTSTSTSSTISEALFTPQTSLSLRAQVATTRRLITALLNERLLPGTLLEITSCPMEPSVAFHLVGLFPPAPAAAAAAATPLVSFYSIETVATQDGALLYCDPEDVVPNLPILVAGLPVTDPVAVFDAVAPYLQISDDKTRERVRLELQSSKSNQGLGFCPFVYPGGFVWLVMVLFFFSSLNSLSLSLSLVLVLQRCRSLV